MAAVEQRQAFSKPPAGGQRGANCSVLQVLASHTEQPRSLIQGEPSLREMREGIIASFGDLTSLYADMKMSDEERALYYDKLREIIHTAFTSVDGECGDITPESLSGWRSTGRGTFNGGRIKEMWGSTVISPQKEHFRVEYYSPELARGMVKQQALLLAG